jgi:hypothetical protein
MVLKARAVAAPTVYLFAERLRTGDAKLVEELDKASRIVTAEGVRSAMIATCQRLELWPPSPAPTGVQECDCSFEDVSAPLPMIAQRLYNDEKRRRSFFLGKDGGTDPMRRQAMMAIFITEFALAAGASLPAAPETYEGMLQEFYAQAAEWEATPNWQKPNNKDVSRQDGQDVSGTFARKVITAFSACQNAAWE